MEKAKYKKTNNDIETIEAKNVNNNLYEKIYKGNLYCEEDECMAEVIFYEKQKGGFRRLFKTKSGSNHLSGCRHEIIREGTRGKTVKLNGENVNVSPKHIDDTLNEAYKTFYKKVHNIEDATQNKSNKNHKKKSESSTVDNEKSINYVVNSGPTTNGEGILVEGKKEPYIYKREVADLKEKDDNSYREVHGILEDIRLYRDEAYIDIKGLDGSSMSVYIGTPFKSDYEQEFRLLENYKTHLQFQKENGNLVICNCVGEIIKMDKKRVVQVYSYRDIKLDNLGLLKVSNILTNIYN
ncbi:hypothetical protein BJV38_002046 [Clostridium beijerinckii]|uniref:hypothetical protein n=1 Tax=Clostridium beijerinckii TaxID=1520 RepID=UPI00156FA070|nr:hypothetical protein [Clostridium beijerinckii]NRT35368.1 hypothetical protein [Clostridium beijerinckii]NRT45203.1 hypothetical protein [Clostridium beijerinckii]NRZ20800.1 hypothetical protein [Clostridium beijerinckii]